MTVDLSTTIPVRLMARRTIIEPFKIKAGCGAILATVILAMGVSPGDALGSVRLTLGRSTTEPEVARAAEALVRSWRQARGS
jgi:hypothetical protein